MAFQEDYLKQLPVKLSGVQLVTAALIILISLLGVMFQFNELSTLCFCTLNYLAWSWIAFGISIFISLISLNILFFNENKITKYLFVLQSIAFFFGIFYMVMFGAKLMDVV